MNTPAQTRHLVAVWNPAYADAMAATIEVLLSRVRAFRADEIEDEDVFVWWGKIKSANRQQPLKYLGEILAIDENLKGDAGADREVHLYVTDYRSLYVCHVAEITAEDVRKDDDGAVPSYLAGDDIHCDCWFRLFDIRRVISDDTRGVVDELRKLANVHYNDRPVSIYGGMVDLPLIATRPDGARYFESDVRAAQTGELFWVEFDAQHSGVGQMEKELRDNLLGESAWSALDPAARTFIATAETLFRNHRNDPAFDFAPVIIGFAKAFEVQVNRILRAALASVPARDRMFNIDGRSTDVGSGAMWSLGQLAHLLSEHESLNKALKKLLDHGEWFTSQLPPVLKELSERRNPAAHSSRVDVKDATRIRNRLMGVGGAGVFVDLGKARRR